MPFDKRRRPSFRARPGIASAEVAGQGLPWAALIVLASAMFISQTIEFLPSGLLPDMAADFDRSLAAVGQLVTAFAAAVVISTTPLSALTRRLPRKPTLLVALISISIAGAAVAAAPNFGVLIAARVIAGVAHGAFWTVAASYAAYLVPHHMLGRAMAVTGLGGSLASILGVPLGNALGQWVGWRVSFLVVAGAGLLVAVVAARGLPPVDVGSHEDAPRSGAGWEGTFRPVLLVCLILLVCVLGPAVFMTYVVPWLSDVAGLPGELVPVYLLATGVAGTLGLVATGAFYDRYPRASFTVAGGTAAVALCGMALVGGSGPVVAVVALAMLWSAAFACLPAMLQTRSMKIVAPGARPLAAALQTTAINVGLGGGAAAGGLALGAVGLSSLPWVAVALLVSGLAISLGTDRRAHRR